MSVKPTYEELEKKLHELELKQFHLKENEKFLKYRKQQYDSASAFPFRSENSQRYPANLYALQKNQG